MRVFGLVRISCRRFSHETHNILRLPLQRATPEALSRYGNIFTDLSKEQVRIEKWPQPGWREVHDGVSGGTTSGDFLLEWRGASHFAVNTGVSEGQYCFAWTDPLEAIKFANTSSHTAYHTTKSAESTRPHPSSRPSPPNEQRSQRVYAFAEINYHACGSQVFYSGEAPYMLLLAESRKGDPDFVVPSDFKAFLVEKGVGVNVNAFVWHAPPIAATPGGRVLMQTAQARVHTKVYYNPLTEHNTLLEIPFAIHSD